MVSSKESTWNVLQNVINLGSNLNFTSRPRDHFRQIINFSEPQHLNLYMEVTFSLPQVWFEDCTRPCKYMETTSPAPAAQQAHCFLLFLFSNATTALHSLAIHFLSCWQSEEEQKCSRQRGEHKQRESETQGFF